MTKTVTLLCLELLVVVSSFCAVPKNGTVMHELEVKLFGLPVGQTPLIAARDEKLYLFDDRTNRLFICDQAGRASRVVGSIGDGEGQFYKPTAMTTTARSIVIYDKGNSRIVILSLEGDVERYIPIQYDIYGIAGDDRGLIYVNNPSSGYLVTVLDSKGNVVRRFGDIPKVSALYNTNNETQDQRLRLTAGRVRLAISTSGNLFAVFVVAPVLREYSPEGKLENETNFEDSRSKPLAEIFWHGAPTGTLITYGILDGNQIPFITKDIAFDPVAKHLVILTALSQIIVFDVNGRQLGALTIRGVAGWQIWKMAVEGSSIWLVRVFLPGAFHGTIPDQLLVVDSQPAKEKR